MGLERENHKAVKDKEARRLKAEKKRQARLDRKATNRRKKEARDRLGISPYLVVEWEMPTK